MNTLKMNLPVRIQGWRIGQYFILDKLKGYIMSYLVVITFFFTLIGKMLVFVYPAAGVLDIGIITVAVFGLLVGVAAILCSLWLQELLWQPFKVFRNKFQSHFNQLTSWQQCILYFSVFFLMLFACLWGMEIVF